MTNNQQLVIDNMDLAQRMARKRAGSFPMLRMKTWNRRLISAFVDAASKYVPEQNDNFSAYASARIAGAMCDYLRELQWGTQSSPVKAEIYEDQVAVSDDQGVGELMAKITAILPDSGRTVVVQYYTEEKKMREIAADIGVNESRVSQVSIESYSRLKRFWQPHESELWAEVA
jgi:RNA polymerase sigma factor (sigma-70 family)